MCGAGAVDVAAPLVHLVAAVEKDHLTEKVLPKSHVSYAEAVRSCATWRVWLSTGIFYH